MCSHSGSGMGLWLEGLCTTRGVSGGGGACSAEREGEGEVRAEVCFFPDALVGMTGLVQVKGPEALE
jgi:hypothetical protein